jgi:hypothetical protein
MKLLSVSLAVVILLAGCSTTGTPTNEAMKVSPTRLLAPVGWRAPAAGAGQLSIKRDHGLVGSACTVRIFVDAVPVAELLQREIVTLYLPLGDYVVSATPSTSVCPDTVVESGVRLTEAKPTVLRVGFAQSLDLVLQPTAF